jgi:hypothetical protein
LSGENGHKIVADIYATCRGPVIRATDRVECAKKIFAPPSCFIRLSGVLAGTLIVVAVPIDFTARIALSEDFELCRMLSRENPSAFSPHSAHVPNGARNYNSND